LPKIQSGPAISASRSATGSTRPSTNRYRFIQPVSSAAKWSTPSGDQRGSETQSDALPATVVGVPSDPSSWTGATFSSVPSQGMFGWRHSSHDSIDPSGEKRGAA
jgi:hypothetical protein